ncbi:MAG: hypothetical protein ACI9BD_001301, partial [Candidatus Marinamargulisbacteria bacterium]
MKKKAGFVVLYLVLIGFALKPTQPIKSDFDIHSFTKIPTVHKGRIKPLDSVARNALLIISGKQSLRLENKKMAASEWLLRVFTMPEKTDKYPVFLVNHPQVKMMLEVFDPKEKRISFDT